MRFLIILVVMSGCASEPTVVYQDRLIEVPVPVIQKVPEKLTRDCVPDTDIPKTGKLPIGDVLKRLDAVEFALDLCRNDKEEIRKAQATKSE